MSDSLFGHFAIDLKRFGEKAEANVERIFQKVALDLFRGVVMSTPVDTGRARGNWQVTLGAPASGEVNVTGSALGVGAASVAHGAETVKRAKGDVSIFLTNNLPYIRALEYGHSKQAPNGMVRQNVARFPYLVDVAAHFESGGGT